MREGGGSGGSVEDFAGGFTSVAGEDDAIGVEFGDGESVGVPGFNHAVEIDEEGVVAGGLSAGMVVTVEPTQEMGMPVFGEDRVPGVLRGEPGYSERTVTGAAFLRGFDRGVFPADSPLVTGQGFGLEPDQTRGKCRRGGTRPYRHRRPKGRSCVNRPRRRCNRRIFRRVRV
jgi:hypothetical protein